MPPRRCSASAVRHFSDLDSDTDDYDDDNFTMRCLSCEEDYDPDDAGTCKECYEEANETEEELKREIEELKSKVSFLKLLSPVDPTFRFNPYALSTTDLLLVPSGDSSVGLVASVPAHKAVLVSRSPVFKAMLENDMEESQSGTIKITDVSRSPVFKAMLENDMEESRSGTIKITDVSYDALRAFVSYLYTAEACLDEQMACNLLVLAEKYQVKHLKTYCEKFLITKLNWEKAVANYAFAHQHNAKQLLDAALAVITDNMDKLTKNEDYADLVDSNPRLVVEIYEAYLAKQVNTASSLKL